MKATGINLGEVSDLVHTELAKYLGAPAWPRRRGLHQDAGHPRRRPPRTRPTGHQQVPDAHRTALRGTGLRNPDHRLRRKERDLPMTTGAARPVATAPGTHQLDGPHRRRPQDTHPGAAGNTAQTGRRPAGRRRRLLRGVPRPGSQQRGRAHRHSPRPADSRGLGPDRGR